MITRAVAEHVLDLWRYPRRSRPAVRNRANRATPKGNARGSGASHHESPIPYLQPDASSARRIGLESSDAGRARTVQRFELIVVIGARGRVRTHDHAAPQRFNPTAPADR